LVPSARNSMSSIATTVGHAGATAMHLQIQMFNAEVK
jgi:hypothetical protein